MRHTCLLHLLEPLVNPRENPLGVAEAAQVAVANRLAPAALPVNHCTKHVYHSTQTPVHEQREQTTHSTQDACVECNARNNGSCVECNALNI